MIKQYDLAIYVHVLLNFTCDEFMYLAVIALFSYLDAACKHIYSLKFNFSVKHTQLVEERGLGLSRQRLVELQLLTTVK